ncbi:MAG: NAD-dependent epimerase/dehydratase family protein [bacterium]
MLEHVRNKRIFISGGAGVIGSELVDLLYKQGAKIFVGDLKKRPPHFPHNILYRQGDLNYISQEELLAFSPEYFFHLAATFERSTETYSFWDENFQHNVKLSNHLTNCLKDCTSLKKIIFASSYLIYDQLLYTFSTPQEKAFQLNEHNSIIPRNLCGAAKLYHEAELEFLKNFKPNIEIVMARIFRSYGKDSRDIISRWVRALLNNEPIQIYCKEGLFDYIYAGDVARGLLEFAKQGISGIINLGTDNARSINEVVTILKKHFPHMHATEISSNILYEASQANMNKCKTLTGWKPSFQLEDTIPMIIEHEKKNTTINLDEALYFNVLITSISKKVPLIKSVRKAFAKLGNIGKIYGADANHDCISRFFIDTFWLMPQLSNLNPEDIINFCTKNNISCVIPTRDGELKFFATHKNVFKKNGISIMVPDLENVTACLDKFLFYQKCATLGLPAIQTTENLEKISCNTYVVKERFGAGAKQIGINLLPQEAKTHALNLETPIFQPFIEGQEYSIDVFVGKKGKAKGAVVRKRDVVINGESQITTVLKHEILEKNACSWAEMLNIYGHAVFQVIINNNNQIHIIECNSRFGGASSLSLEMGLDSFYWFFLEALNVSLDDYKFIPSKHAKKQIRYAEDLVLDDHSF